MFEELFGNCQQAKILDFFFSAPVEEYTKQHIVVGSGISGTTLDKFIETLLENEIIIQQPSGYILNTKSEFTRKLVMAQDEFIKFHFNKQLDKGIEEYKDVSDAEINKFLNTIPDYLDFNELENGIEYGGNIPPINTSKEYFLSFSSKNNSEFDFSSTNDEKLYDMDVI